MAREKAKADGGGTSEHDFVKWLWGTDPAEALDVTRTILTKSGNKLLEFVAKNMLKAAPAKQGQPKKFTEEISRAYFELAQERAASAAERFIPTNKEVYEKLKDFGVWVRTKGNSDSCPPGFKAVNQKTVETTCAKLRNRDEANPANRQQMYAMFASQRARQETLLKAKRNIQRELLLNPAVQKMMAAQDEALLDAEPMAPLVDAEYEALLNGERKALNAEPPGAEDQDCRK